MAAGVFDSIDVKQLRITEIRLQTSRGTTDGIPIIDSDGFTVARIDSTGNLHIRGSILKDL